MTDRMTDAEVLAIIDELIGVPVIECLEDEQFVNRAKNMRAAVSALIARNAELTERLAAAEAEREALRADAERLDWMDADMAKGDDGVGIYSDNGFFIFPYLVSNAGGSGGGVGEACFDTLRQAIDAARTEASHG